MTLASEVRPATVGTEEVLTVSGLAKRFGDRVAVDDISFTVAPGETYGLLGPNGAGKTTTIRLVCGLLRADRGSCVIAGRPVGPSEVGAKRLVGYVPQEVALYPELTAQGEPSVLRAPVPAGWTRVAAKGR
jgi:ABC-2 type transport system ATP-binding protein